MWRAFYADNPLVWLPLVAMFGFLLLFVAAAVRAWIAHGDDDRARTLPLDDDALSHASPHRSTP